MVMWGVQMNWAVSWSSAGPWQGSDSREQLCQLRGSVFFCQAEDGIRGRDVTGVQTCALPISNTQGGDPSDQHLRWNTSTQASATAIEIANIDKDGQDVSGLLLDNVMVGAVLHLQKASDAKIGRASCRERA